jgi:protein-disulfide isomerase
MTLTRRSALTFAGGVVAVGVVGYFGWRGFAPVPAPAQPVPPIARAATSPAAGDLRKAERSLGDPAAKVTVMEFFSLTCTHCAAFSRITMPQVEKELVAPGKVRFVYHDFPLDQVALTAAMVARYLPPSQYYPFVSALFASQDRWAFARGVNNTDEIWKLAALAGMSRQTFEQAIADTDLKNWILQQQQADQDRWKIDSTPSFVINGQKAAGDMSFEAFRKLLPEA